MDKYDEAIAYLLAQEDFHDAVKTSWSNPLFIKAGCLFQYVTPSGELERDCDGLICSGCLTIVRAGIRRACTPELTDRIRADNRLPDSPDKITKESLPVFAEWQRELDRTIRQNHKEEKVNG